MARKNRTIMSAVAVVGIAFAAMTMATPASALGLKSDICDPSYGRSFAGSSTANGTATSESGGDPGDCGLSRVRAIYRIVSGGTIYYASWASGSNYASSNPGNIIIGANHNVTRPKNLGKGDLTT